MFFTEARSIYKNKWIFWKRCQENKILLKNIPFVDFSLKVKYIIYSFLFFFYAKNYFEFYNKVKMNIENKSDFCIKRCAFIANRT